MAIKDQPTQIEFQSGALTVFSTLTQRMQNKLYNLIGKYVMGEESDLRRAGLLKDLNDPALPQAFVLHLNRQLRAIFQLRDDHILLLDILDLDLAKKYFG